MAQHTIEATRRALLASVDISATAQDDRAPVWIQIAKSGSFRGHYAGPFELNSAVFSEIIRNFNATANHRVPIDYEHLSERDDIDATTGAPAQGWIVDLKVDGGNLWGLVEWVSDLAVQQIRSRQYMFLSPAIVFGARDPETGEKIGARLSSAALTNSPFLDGMVPVAAKRIEGEVLSTDENDGEVIPIALGLPLEAPPMVCTAALAAIDQWVDSMRLAPAAGVSVSVDGVVHLGRGMTTPPQAKAIHSLKTHLRLPAHATWPEIRASAEKVIAMTTQTSNAAPVAPSTSTTNGATPMATGATEQNGSSEQIKLMASLQASNTELTVKLAKAESDLATAKASAKVELDAANAKIAGLEKDKADRDAKDVAALVDNAIRNCGMKEKDRAHLTDFARTNRAAFENMFPMVPPAQAYLASTIAAGRNGEAPAQQTVGGLVPEPRRVDVSEELPKMEDLIAKYQRKGMDLEAAIIKAHAKLEKAVKKLAEREQGRNGPATAPGGQGTPAR